jgi:hypothetical protein
VCFVVSLLTSARHWASYLALSLSFPIHEMGIVMGIITFHRDIGKMK